MTDENDDDFLGKSQPRDEHGRFAEKSEPAPKAPPADVSPQSAPPPAKADPAPVRDPAATTPTGPTASDQPNPEPWKEAKWWDEKEKRQRLERELEQERQEKAALRRQIEERERQPQAPIDPFMDPEGFQQSIEEREWKTITRVTRMFASRQHGEDAVVAAEAWLQRELETNPGFFQTIMRQPDPYDFVVKQHKRQQSFAKLGDDEPETWAEKWARENGYVKAGEGTGQAPPAAGPSPQSPKPSLPRPSIASAPAAAPVAKANVLQDERELFGEVFRKR